MVERHLGREKFMSLKVRGILVLVIGTVLGLTVSIGGQLISRSAEAHRVAGVRSQEPAEILADIIARVSEEYVDQIDERTLIESAIRGIIEELDNHSRYLDTLAYEDIRISTSGHYAGVGLDVALQQGQPTVVSPIENTPAERAGILAGDIVVAVDGEAVTASNFQSMVGRMRGVAGTAVNIELQRDGSDEPLHFALLRANIEVKTVYGEHLGDGFAYIRLTGFADNTAPGLDVIAERITREAGGTLRGLVLDLRNNPGGLLDSAVAVADRFLDQGLIVRGTGRIQHARFEHHATAGHALEDVPLVIIVNSGSASASEIVAGALKDHARARIVGIETYGKGSVQTVMPLSEGRALKITTSRYILPSGRTLSGDGISPDIRIANSEPRRQFRGTASGVAMREDPQMIRALRVIGYDPMALSQAL